MLKHLELILKPMESHLKDFKRDETWSDLCFGKIMLDHMGISRLLRKTSGSIKTYKLISKFIKLDIQNNDTKMSLSHYALMTCI